MDKVPFDELRKIEIPTAVPLVYNLDENLEPIGLPDAVGFRGRFLVDSEKRDAEYLANLEVRVVSHTVSTESQIQRQ